MGATSQVEVNYTRVGTLPKKRGWASDQCLRARDDSPPQACCTTNRACFPGLAFCEELHSTADKLGMYFCLVSFGRVG